MKTTVRISCEKEDIIEINFDIFEAVWGYLLFDNISLLASKKQKYIELFSFSSGKEQASGEVKEEDLEKLSKCNFFKINYSLGNDNCAVYKREPIDTTGKFLEAIEAQFEGKNTTAIECYKAVVEANPSNFRAYNLLARCLRAEGNIDEALKCYNKAIELTQNSPEIYCNLGILFQKEGLDEKAQEAFCKAIDIDNFYCNALIKRATWLLNNDPDNSDLKLYNLRLSAVHEDVTSAQNHIKAYMKLMGYDRVDYSDKETAFFGEFADYNLQKKLKLIENYINNGAYGTALANMKEVLESTKGSSAKDQVACWCHSRAKRSVLRLGDTANHEVWKEFSKIVSETPTEDDLKVLAEEALKREALEKAMKEDRETAKKREKEALVAMENKVYDDGDYSSPIGVPVEKEMTEKEREEALEEQALLIDNSVEAPKPVKKETDSSNTSVVENKKEVITNNDKPNDKVSEKETKLTETLEIKKETKTAISEKSSIESKQTDSTESKNEPEPDLLTGVDDVPAPPPPSDNYDLLTAIEEMPAPSPVIKQEKEGPSILSMNDIPAPKPVLSAEKDSVPIVNPLDVPAPKPVLTKNNDSSNISSEVTTPNPKPEAVPSTETPELASSGYDDDLLMAGVDDMPAPPPPSSSYDLLTGVDDMPAPAKKKPVSEEDLLSENDDIPAPRADMAKESLNSKNTVEKTDSSVSSSNIEPVIKPKSTAELMAEADKNIGVSESESEPAMKPMSTAELMAEASKSINTSSPVMDSGLKPMSTAELMAEANKSIKSGAPVMDSGLKPKTTAELMAEAKDALLPPEPVFGAKRKVEVQEQKPILMPKSTAELMAEASKVVLPPDPVLIQRPDTKGIELSKDYKSPVKNVKPVTIQEFFMLVLFEVMRDGNIEKSEENFLKTLKNQLKISDNDFMKMFNHVKNQVKTVGYKKEEGSFNPKRLFKNLCQAAWRDGVLEESEKQLLLKVCKGFGIPGGEAKKIMMEAKKLVDEQNAKEAKNE